VPPPSIPPPGVKEMKRTYPLEKDLKKFRETYAYKSNCFLFDLQLSTRSTCTVLCNKRKDKHRQFLFRKDEDFQESFLERNENIV
jgi:hypothetical protein